MRQLRELPDANTAQLLCDALLERGIEAELMDNQRGTFGVWVVEEQKLPEAQSLASAWLDQGQREALEQAGKRGRATRELTARIEDRRQRQQEAVAQHMAQLSRPRPPVLTWGLSALCIAVFLATEYGGSRNAMSSLLIVDLQQRVGMTELTLFGQHFTWLELPWREPWRFVTPILLHFGPLHILFNVLWLGILGRTIEAHHGARYLASFVLVSAALPNIAQFEIAQNPMFGGLSGVVYGLFGLIWMRGRLDMRIGYGLSRGSVQFMLIWLGLGFIGELATGLGMAEGAGIANWCHLGGLLVGVCWGYLAAKLAR